jgi:5-methylcytosine-specific restriction endonuclease McrBC GTP-binding regulatory subunit McrB
VILSGISGTGKTKLAQLVADYIVDPTPDSAEKAFVSVRPDWTDNSYLLGWYNAIAEQYETTPVLKLIIAADSHPDVPHFIILDEMNIAKVEHYFSDFLSCMETRRVDPESNKVRQEPIHLRNHTDEENGDEDCSVPAKIEIPVNIYVTGTVNVDESTYMFSPKVLDRANVIELNDVYLDPDSWDQAGGEAPGSEGFVLKQDVDLRELLTAHKPPTTDSLERMKELMPDEFSHLLLIHDALKPYHMHFGYRVANEIASFMLNAQKLCVGGDEVLPFAFDLQVMQKILPKMHGNASQLIGPIDSLIAALPESCTISRDKLTRMKKRLEQVGFASFIE